MLDQDTIDNSRDKPEVLRRQVVPVPLPPLARGHRSTRWLFVRCTSLTAAATRLQGWRGDDHRVRAMRACCRAFFRANGTPKGEAPRPTEPFTGVAMLSPEGVVVAAYYGPGHPNNTPVAAADYMRAMRFSSKERLVPITQDTEVDKGRGLLPLAARTDRPRFE